ncbi:phospholipase A and acyltransferase 3-like [Alosa sapidissima]|uniref:phospholipase A and acyltransferase 3-like n=1 Tax=Alosa sapidissima TaxID=34773 RepID=UPI001C08AC95|nr:phospholipase A and acyltransferase 3-like [Alosa sapidissima]
MEKPGDLIEIDRVNYQHWALYIGDGYVIHLTTDGDSASKGAAIGGSSASIFAIVKKQELSDVAAADIWRVNNSLDKKWMPQPPDVILKIAQQLVGKKIQYRLLNYNCEHFVTNIRYGKPESRQAKKAKQVVEGSGLILTGVLGTIALALVSVFAPRTS